jgi:hypothetical protein
LRAGIRLLVKQLAGHQMPARRSRQIPPIRHHRLRLPSLSPRQARRVNYRKDAATCAVVRNRSTSAIVVPSFKET